MSIFGGEIGVNWFFSQQQIIPLKTVEHRSSRKKRPKISFLSSSKQNLWAILIEHGHFIGFLSVFFPVISFDYLCQCSHIHIHITHTHIHVHMFKSSSTWHRQQDCVHLLRNQNSISIFLRWAILCVHIHKYLYLCSTMKTD